MPIKPENRKLYPSNWDEISRDIRVNRAGNKCERCGIPNHAVGYRDPEGEFVPLAGGVPLDAIGVGEDPLTGDLLDYKHARGTAEFHTLHCEMGYKYIVIVLTVAHLDHNPANCEYSNLWALCQKCHNNYDSAHRANTIKESKLNGQLKLSI